MKRILYALLLMSPLIIILAMLSYYVNFFGEMVLSVIVLILVFGIIGLFLKGIEKLMFKD